MKKIILCSLILFVVISIHAQTKYQMLTPDRNNSKVMIFTTTIKDGLDQPKTIKIDIAKDFIVYMKSHPDKYKSVEKGLIQIIKNVVMEIKFSLKDPLSFKVLPKRGLVTLDVNTDTKEENEWVMIYISSKNGFGNEVNSEVVWDGKTVTFN